MDFKNNKLIMFLICIIVLLSLLCILFATGTISFNSKDTHNSTENNYDVDNDSNGNEEYNNDDINIDISIGDVVVSKEAMNSNFIILDGTINLSYDNTKYDGVALSGYCLGKDNEKYFIGGPRDGRALFHNDENNKLSLSLDYKNVEYSDGTNKSLTEINWDTVKIKYCKIDSMTVVSNNYSNNSTREINFEKSFE